MNRACCLMLILVLAVFGCQENAALTSEEPVNEPAPDYTGHVAGTFDVEVVGAEAAAVEFTVENVRLKVTSDGTNTPE